MSPLASILGKVPVLKTAVKHKKEGFGGLSARESDLLTGAGFCKSMGQNDEWFPGKDL
jgi:hypothetical protein